RYTDPYISECNISNTKVGIYLDNAEYQPDMEEGAKILNTSVSSGLTGLDLYESSAKIMSCNIESDGTGISIYSNSFPVFSRSMDYGLNRITGQDLGMDISYSTPLLGYKEIEYYGYNSITKAEEGEYDLMANEAGTIYSQECWWGESTPNTDHFSLQNSYLEYEPALTYDPFGDTYQNIGNNNSAKSARIEPEGGDNPTLSLKDKYKAALRKYLSGELSEARQMCRNIILSFPDSATTFSSFYLLLQIEGKAGNRSDSLNGFLGSINPGNLKKKLYLLAKIKLAENSQPGSYPQVITGLQNWYPDTVMAPYLLFKKLKYYLDISKNKDSVEVIKNQLTVSYPHHKLTREAKILIGMDELQKRGGNSVSVIPVKPVLENYPNPFNPSTTIRYGINIPGEVKIGIYNILGELVQVLVNEEKEKGIYTTTLNANRFSSGVYICRMISADGVLVRKIMLLR
ncbi:MAG: T9SS type A sorting domain-containing protein, partial [Ignavibacteriaceae bacterium]|nr:T9SS type A sorting domain-containing protein [Ignavibacteriaceae bacterium]